MKFASAPDRLTAACIGLLAMCVVTSDHEALGHGSACLLVGGHIVTLTSSIFRCDVHAGWIDLGGPLGNLVGGALALGLSRVVPARFTGLKLFLVAVTAFSWFWEGAYAPYAMARRNGDLYFFAQFLLGDVSPVVRGTVALCGIALFFATARLTSRALLMLWSDARVARGIARTLWQGATLGAAGAAFTYRGAGWGDLKDAVLEIGVASLPLLFIPRERADALDTSAAILPRSYLTIALAIAVFALFAATLGRGIGVI